MAIQNGIDVNKLNDLIDIIRSNPEVANFEFRTETEWINGAHSKTKIQSSSGKLFTYEADEPHILLGTDLSPIMGVCPEDIACYGYCSKRSAGAYNLGKRK